MFAMKQENVFAMIPGSTGTSENVSSPITTGTNIFMYLCWGMLARQLLAPGVLVYVPSEVSAMPCAWIVCSTHTGHAVAIHASGTS